jgi:hypothetical protein
MNYPNWKTILMATLCLGGMGCSYDGGPGDLLTDGGPPPGLPINLTGDWEGTWTSSSGDTGHLSIEFLQAATAFGGGSAKPLLGTTELEGFPCTALLDVDASLFPGGFVSFTHASGIFTDGSLTIDIDLNVTLDFMSVSGTYEVLDGSLCEGDTGTIQATMNAPILPLAATRPEVGQTQTIVLIHDDFDNNISSVLVELIDSKTGVLYSAQSTFVTPPASEPSPVQE